LVGRIVLAAVGSRAAISEAATLGPQFGEHAVLQRNQAIPVWGSGSPGERITLTFGNQTRSTVTDTTGRWMCFLSPMPASSHPDDLTVQGQNVICVRDVLVGDIWLCAGQSNMDFVLQGPPGSIYRVEHADLEIETANYPTVRQFRVGFREAEAPATSVEGEWQVCSPATAANFSAIGLFFAEEIERSVGVPIGIVVCACGGSPIESWLSQRALNSRPKFAEVMARWQREAGGQSLPKTIYDGALALRRPACLYNGMVAPLLPAAICGVLWYQGEANGARPEEYRDLFSTLVTTWRLAFEQPRLPFYFVQLPKFDAPGLPRGDAWAYLREAQAVGLPETGMAVTIDLGDSSDIHPRDKRPFAHRLALLAEANRYHLPVSCYGPVFRRADAHGSIMIVSFAHADRGLIARGPSVGALALAGQDRKFHPAIGRIVGPTLLVSSPDVPVPIAVRYAWSNVPSATLYNTDGLPAAPFRSDDWPPSPL
jgi:sialate O-acetylesterase